MLNKNRISSAKILSEDWKINRLAKFTSSGIYQLCQPKEKTAGFMTYVYQKVGEELTGKSAQEELQENDSMRWGLAYEAEAINKFGQIKGIDFVVVQQLITVPNTRFGGTPDTLIMHSESTDGTAFNVSSVEVKCFPTFARYIPLALCKTPQEIKYINSNLYWQVLDQMDICDCLIGYAVMYHPLFKAGNLSIVEFKKVDLYEDLRFLKQRKQMASDTFDEVRAKLLALGRF